MTIEREIKINNKKYYIGIDIYYKNKKVYKKSKKFNNYFDFGDLSYLINNIEEKYNQNIYDNIPFISYIKDTSTEDTLIIYRNDIELYIKENNIKLNNYYLESITPLFFK